MVAANPGVARATHREERMIGGKRERVEEST